MGVMSEDPDDDWETKYDAGASFVCGNIPPSRPNHAPQPAGLDETAYHDLPPVTPDTQPTPGGDAFIPETNRIMIFRL